MSTAVDTKRVTERRELAFASLEDVLADVEALDARDARTTGNWTAAQNVLHVTTVIDWSIDGFPFRAPWLMRTGARLLRKRFMARTFPSGIHIPAGFRGLAPREDVTWDEARDACRRAVVRVRDGARMTAPSPIFGPLSHEQWERLHCRHAELHFGFILPADRA